MPTALGAVKINATPAVNGAANLCVAYGDEGLRLFTPQEIEVEAKMSCECEHGKNTHYGAPCGFCTPTSTLRRLTVVCESMRRFRLS